MIAMSEKTSQLNYSDSSYKGNLHNGDSIIEECQYSITGINLVTKVIIYSDNRIFGISIGHTHN